MRHTVWCDQPGTESHESCAARLGTVVVNDAVMVELSLSRQVDHPAVLLLNLTDHGRPHLAVLNVERAHELSVLVRFGVELMASRPNG